MMFFATALFLAAQAILPSVQATPRNIRKNNWIELDCYVAGVKIGDTYTKEGEAKKDKWGNPILHYDWQLTYQVCKIYTDSAYYDPAKGRCISKSPDGLGGADWWDNCERQSINGWYDVDPSTNDIVINHAPYHADYAQGHGQRWSG
ncbi:hypothetical protein PTMSG1_07287 [Pyrenophora teres f. maculata]|nr:hypothetical protein PTMSG1_07287 [Pyrenophora teres f. maculata]